MSCLNGSQADFINIPIRDINTCNRSPTGRPETVHLLYHVLIQVMNIYKYRSLQEAG